MQLTANQIRCLLAILSLTRLDEAVASKNVARLMGITRPSAHKALDTLLGRQLIEKEHYGAVTLTKEGLAIAERLEERKERLQLMFARRFGLAMDESSTAAVLLMSELREESLQALERADQ